MRTAPQSIAVQQERYAWGTRLWTCLWRLPYFVSMAVWVTTMLDPGLNRSLRLLLASLALVSLMEVPVLNPQGRAARCRKASDLLGGKIIRYEVGESVSDSDLAAAVDQAARIMLAPLPAPPIHGYWPRRRDGKT